MRAESARRYSVRESLLGSRAKGIERPRRKRDCVRRARRIGCIEGRDWIWEAEKRKVLNQWVLVLYLFAGSAQTHT